MEHLLGAPALQSRLVLSPQPSPPLPDLVQQVILEKASEEAQPRRQGVPRRGWWRGVVRDWCWALP